MIRTGGTERPFRCLDCGFLRGRIPTWSWVPEPPAEGPPKLLVLIIMEIRIDIYKGTHCIYLKLIFQSLMMTFDITPAGGLWQLWLGGLAWTGGRWWWWWGQPDQPKPTKLQSLSGRPRGGRAGGWGWAKDWNWSSGDLHFCFTY